MKRFGLVALSIGLGLLALAVPATASNGGTAVVSATVNGTGTNATVDLVSTKRLSRVTVVLCEGETIIFDSWGSDQKSATVPVGDGTVQAVLIHSGDNTTVEAQTLLSDLAGSDAVKGNSTGSIAFYSPDACQETTPTAQPPTTTTTQPPVVPTTQPAPVVTTQPPATVVTQPPAASAPVVEQPTLAPTSTPVSELPRTGSAAGALAVIGAMVGVAGVALLLISTVIKRSRI